MVTLKDPSQDPTCSRTVLCENRCSLGTTGNNFQSASSSAEVSLNEEEISHLLSLRLFCLLELPKISFAVSRMHTSVLTEIQCIGALLDAEFKMVQINQCVHQVVQSC